MGDMMTYEGLYIGPVLLDRMRDGIADDVLAVFQDSMQRSFEARARDVYGAGVTDDDEEMAPVLELVAAGRSIAERLDVLGVTSTAARKALAKEFEFRRQDPQRWSWADNADAEVQTWVSTRRQAEANFLSGYTVDQWIADLRTAHRANQPENRQDVGSFAWLLDLASIGDTKLLMRSALLVWPDEEIRLDLTAEMEEREIQGDSRWPDALETLCSDALEALRGLGAEHAPLVVLTEGKTDIRVLEPALGLLYPHLVDLVRFMDYDQRPQGGAGHLVTTVRSFAAAGIANRVVALFDNDTAAGDALRKLNASDMPANIRIRQYPRLELAERYPTLGPPSQGFPNGRVDIADVNGLAGSIELYLGRDVLTSPDGSLRPVQWQSYVPGMRRYQGEIAEKDAVLTVYEAKVKAALADRTCLASQDWSGIRAIIGVITSAFEGS